MTDININQLYNSVLEKKIQKYKTYESVLQLCHQRIKRYTENMKLQCLYKIPHFIIGTPLYNFQELKKFLMQSLRKSGFYVQPLNEDYLYISWDLKQNKTFKKKQTSSTNFRNVHDYNPSGNFIHQSFGIESIQDKLNFIHIK